MRKSCKHFDMPVQSPFSKRRCIKDIKIPLFKFAIIFHITQKTILNCTEASRVAVGQRQLVKPLLLVGQDRSTGKAIWTQKYTFRLLSRHHQVHKKY